MSDDKRRDTGKPAEWGSFQPPANEDLRERAFRLSQQPSAPRLITGEQFAAYLEQAGIIRPEDRVRRVVIDAQVGAAVQLFIERFGDDRMIQLATSLQGTTMRIVNVQPQEGEALVDDGRESIDKPPMQIYRPEENACPSCRVGPGEDHEPECPIGVVVQSLYRDLRARGEMMKAGETAQARMGGGGTGCPEEG